MKAIVLHETGPADNLTFQEMATPEPGDDQVVVRVHAAGVCYRDIIDRGGGFPFMKLPVVPGHEFAGEVVAAGRNVQELSVGDRVVNLHRPACGVCEYCKAGHEPRCDRSLFLFGLTIDGGYAEHVLAPAAALVPLPDEVPYAKGCFLVCTAAVALRGMQTRGGLVSGETVVITGASGGVGIHAVQVAKALGARVIAITSSEAKADTIRGYGADEVVVSVDLKFHKQVRAMTDGGAHLTFDCVGVPTLNAAIRSLRPMGRAVMCGNVTVERHAINPGWFILNEVSVAGTSGATRCDLEQVLTWVAEGKLDPVIADSLPLSEAAAAHKRLEARGVMGRLVLTP